jgi:presenilin-like A22 family membrane protease
MLLIIISLYDMYAVWHSGFMQKMAKYQIKQLKLFSGFFVPYMGKEDRIKLQQAKTQELKEKKLKKVKVHLAILGGGDVVFPILLAGVVLRVLGVWQAVLISIGATLALAYLFYRSEKGKFYPAMPFISIGCLIALGIIYLLNLL